MHPEGWVDIEGKNHCRGLSDTGQNPGKFKEGENWKPSKIVVRIKWWDLKPVYFVGKGHEIRSEKMLLEDRFYMFTLWSHDTSFTKERFLTFASKGIACCLPKH